MPVERARSEYLSRLQVRQNTRNYYERYLQRLSGKLSEVTPHDINRILDSLAPSSRNQALATYGTFFRWCIRRHYLDTSPCQRLTLSKPKTRDRTLSDNELNAIWRAAPEGNFGTIVRLLILTGQRRMEIGSLEPGWIRPGAIVFPARICKNNTEHALPVTPDIHRLASELAANLDRPHNTWSKPKVALDQASGVTDWTLHDLRRTFSTIHARIGTAPHVTEALLNHKTGSISPLARIYNRHQYEAEMRAAMTAYTAPSRARPRHNRRLISSIPGATQETSRRSQLGA